MNKLISISVAAYNLEKYIKQNLDSFVNAQNKDYIEVLVIDDESTDKTTSIVEEYEAKYPNIIKLIKQKNAGPGSTVNKGISNATGKYFRMVDGDDWVNTDNLDYIVEKLKKVDADIVITNYDVYDDSKKQIVKTTKPDINIQEDIFKFDDICGQISLDMHNVIFKTSILKENKIRLDNGFYTDVEYLLLPTKFIDTAIYFNKSIYIYRIARLGQSVSLSSLQKHIAQHDEVLKRLVNYYESNKRLLSNEKLIYLANRISLVADSEFITLMSYTMTKDNINRVKNFVKELKFLSEDIYQKFARGKKEKILIATNYKIIKLESKLIKKKFFDETN